MTVKEVEEKLTRMCKRQYDLGNMAGGFAYDMAQLLVREIKDRSGEMIEWTEAEHKRAFQNWLDKWAWDDGAHKFWEGYWWGLGKFLDEFAGKKRQYPFWIEGWDFNA